ncbi:hypothetical protein POVWA2_078640 [Plasmodium ovale wallikeri]|uniref:Uncharacterized protein n=1 Tax=Plasmodium ovale wallikeri TaxID=864142 RepID=A0A1A9AM97_PLAOA|nr:hypothetical protein POVWA1_079700 [Plasmodium ovale wallikeri]SBT57310.1 hypothetical protein POVWA2_078640 [Plasmodium ovale wallikeri]
MTGSIEKCKELVSSSNIKSFLPGNAEKLCQCFSPNPPSDENCKCEEFTGNGKFKQAIENFQKCYGTNADVPRADLPSANLSGSNLSSLNFSSLISSKLELFTKECFTKSLREILDSVDNKIICEVDISDLKQKGEKVLSIVETVGGTVTGALQLFDKVKKVFYDSQSFFTKLIQNFPGYNILYPIIKLFRFIFCRSGKGDKENYNVEQMKQLQEQYNRTLQTNTQLNNFLLGYQNV